MSWERIGVSVSLESDEDFRKRLKYIAGDTDEMLRRIATSTTKKLDDLAEEFGLKRRRI